MNPYTILSRTDLGQILRPYGLESFDAYKSLSGGSENSNYLIRCAKGEFVVTIFEKMTAQKTEMLASLLQHLAAHDFRTNSIEVTLEGQNISTFKRKPILVKKFIKGTIPHELDDKQLVELGKKIADLHQIPCPEYLPKNITYGQDKFHNLLGQFPEHAFSTWLAERQAYILKHLQGDLPTYLIHADIFTNNIVIDPKGEIIIFDFEEACHFFRVFDLGMAIVGVCCPNGDLNVHQAKLLLSGYRQISTMSSLENKLIIPMAVYAATATAYWRFMQFNVLQPDKGLEKHYQGMQRIADQLYFLDPDLLL